MKFVGCVIGFPPNPLASLTKANSLLLRDTGNLFIKLYYPSVHGMCSNWVLYGPPWTRFNDGTYRRR